MSTETITYRTVDSSVPTSQVRKIRTVGGDYDVTYFYTYDDNGNILTVSDATNITSYVYDSANQLIRENNEAEGKTWTYAYDDAGNITQKKEYSFTTGTLGTALDTINYSYGNSVWGDLLTSYDGKTITYDTVGNPLSDGTWTYTWEHGRELMSMTSADKTVTYTYNADGLRVSKTVDGVVHNYVYSDGKLVQETYGDTRLNFSYDAYGNPYTFSYTKGDGKTSVYHYVLNQQGDVIRIVTNKGVTRVTYTYDAWGNIIDTTYTNKTLANANPLRYRGYYYDRDTGLYYLQSRYYNPKVGRFLNADVVYDLDAGLEGYNLFLYCANDPVGRIDISGTDSEKVEDLDLDDDDPHELGAGGVGHSSVPSSPILTTDSQTASSGNGSSNNGGGSGGNGATQIYRYGGTSPSNLTPKSKDQSSGLSFSTTPKPGSATTTIESVNATGVIKAVQDGPTHVSIIPIGGSMSDWIAIGSSSIWTRALKDIVVKY